MIEDKWKWFHKELIENNKLMLVPFDSFDRLMKLFADACSRNGISSSFTRVFIEFLKTKKEYLVENDYNDLV